MRPGGQPRRQRAKGARWTNTFAPLWALLAAGLLLPAFCRPDTLETRTGEKYRGQIKFLQGKIALVQTSGPEVVLDVTNLAQANFHSAPAGPTPRGPAAWHGQDIGLVNLPGSSLVQTNRITIRDSGRGFGRSEKKNRDSFYFLWQEWRRDCQIVARLREQEYVSRFGSAGLMVRSGFDPSDAYALVGKRELGIGFFQARPAAGNVMFATDNSTRPILGASWLKLVREGVLVTAYESVDGEEWTQVGEAGIAMPADGPVYVGLSSCSGGPPGRTLFDFVEIKPVAATATRTLPRGVLTRNGSLLSGEVLAFDDKQVTFQGRDGRPDSLPIGKIAALVFQPLPESRQAMLQGKTGVMLYSGDFVDGEFRGADGDELVLGSVLFGLKRFSVKKEVAALVLRPAPAAPRGWIIRLKDRSLFKTAALQIDSQGLLVQEPDFAPIRVPREELMQLSFQ